MQDQVIDPLVLGHNQFFGVNHLSSSDGAEKERYFKKLDNALGLIHHAVTLGAGGVMLSTHPGAPLILEGIKRDSRLRDCLNTYPLLPYISKYVRSSNEKGIVNAVLDTLGGAGVAEKFRLMVSGGIGLVRKDILKLLKTLIDVELLPFRETRIKAIFLHDALTDLALGLEMRNIFEVYEEHITRSFGALPAYATKNLPLLVDKFSTWGIQTPLVLTHVNKAGFQMNPSRESCEACLRGSKVRIMAMGTLASGYLDPAEAYKYVFSLPGIESVVVGVSTPEHAEETFGTIASLSKGGIVPSVSGQGFTQSP
jgi:hypothetical protein